MRRYTSISHLTNIRHEQVKTSIIKKLSTINFVEIDPIPYQRSHELQYGDENNVELFRDLILKRLNITVDINGKVLFNLIGYLMLYGSPDLIQSLISSLGFINLIDTIDVFYNLLWYIFIADEPFRNELTNEEIAYISGLRNQELLALFPRDFQMYDTDTDRSTLLYSAISGRIVPESNIDYDRYQEIIRYPPPNVWRTALIFYDLISRYELSIYTPYKIIARNPPDVIQIISLNTNNDNIYELINKYGIEFTELYDDLPTDFLIQYFLLQLKAYDEVFKRPPNTPHPPTNQELTIDLLESYTTQELIDAYEQPIPDTRNQLMNDIIIQSQKGPGWRWNHRHCKNDNTWNNVEFERHGDMNKDNPDDPTLSYGRLGNYRCYQISELIQSFTDNPGEFRDPDYDGLSFGIDPITGIEYSETFPLESIKQLQKLLDNTPIGYNIRNIQDLIRAGLYANSEHAIKIRKMKEEYDQFTSDQQYLINLLIAWIFFYGMWMRFWKGPGYPWPYNIHVNDNICIPSMRDEHIHIQNSVFKKIRDMYQNDPILNLWVNRLPALKSKSEVGNEKFFKETFNEVMEAYLSGNACMGFGGNIFYKTGYYFITKLVGLDPIDPFINSILPQLINLEQIVVNEQLSQPELLNFIQKMNQGQNIDPEIKDKIDTLRKRQIELRVPLKQLDIFDITQMGELRHVDRF